MDDKVGSMHCLFVSDLHGHTQKFQSLYEYVKNNSPDAVFFGGDLLPMIPEPGSSIESFINDIILSPIMHLKKKIPHSQFFFILGNDDPRKYEPVFIRADKDKLISYVHEKTVPFSDFFVTGYSFIPPTPFLLKDWERYDVSRFVDVGALSPEHGVFSIPADIQSIRFQTIKKDLDELVKNSPADKTIFLFHSPPYDSVLDRAALDGKKVDYAPVDVHIGSIAIKRFIQKYQPFVTLHGHVHESSQLTGEWQQSFHSTISFSAAYKGEKLAIINFDTNDPKEATRVLL